LLAATPGPADADLVLNEFMASNGTFLADEWGDFDDWIEVLNTGPGSADLTGMFLTDDLLRSTQWPIPFLILGPGERALFWADAEIGEGPRHTSFRLDSAGEAVGLFDTIINGNQLIDSIVFGEQATDRSFGRFPDGAGPWIYMATPTPTLPNVDEGNIPPLVSETDHNPNSPDAGQEVIVTTRMRDLDGTLDDTRLFYDAGGGFLAVTLFDDGLHGDGEAGDQIHGATIPGFPANTSIRYYVRARDDDLDQTLDPIGAPGITYSYVVAFTPPELYINEFMASNSSTIPDEWNEFDDWVEIYNGDVDPIDLGGLTLSDDLAVPNKYTFPTTILAPGDFILVWCDGTPAQGPFHAGFRLSAAGEQVGLFASAANGFAAIDTLTYGPQVTDISFGRFPDGAPNWQFFPSPTPGTSNTGPDAVGDAPAPSLAFRLEPPHPNPVSSRATIRFALPQAAPVTLALYDVLGRRLAVLVDGPRTAGLHSVPLDRAVFRNGVGGGAGGRGASFAGQALPGGVYFLKLDALGAVRVQKLQVMP
jgi:hypothetical protein